MKSSQWILKTCVIVVVIVMAMPLAFANRMIDEITVIGSREHEASLPGSGAYVSNEDIRNQNYDDINEVLRKVPGVYLREEDGYGLFPNVSLRGVDGARSSKVSIMEDGILTAPAAYSAPSAYYTPTTGRMSGIEVLKGSSQIKYGPHTTGGVINYISTPIPEKPTVYLKTAAGSDDEYRVHGYVGNTYDSGFGKLGFLLEDYHRETNGFKEIDLVGGQTGFTKNDPMVKFSWEPSGDTSRYSRLELKAGYSDLVAQETYLGLTDADFDANPYRRYAASRFDEIDSEHTRTYARYLRELNDNVYASLTYYFNKFQRNWFKLNSVNGSGLSGVLATGGNNLSVLKGQAAGTLNYRNNNRSYEVWGLAGDVDWNFETGDLEHAVEVGLGYHEDHIRRRQWNVDFSQDSSGNIAGRTIGVDGGAGNRKQESQAVRVYIKDDITWGDLTVTPGFRHESVDYKVTNFNTAGLPDTITSTQNGGLSANAYGVGVNYKVDEFWSVFGGAHEGFSLPGPRDNTNTGLSEEKSISTEIGARYAKNALSSELVYFNTQFKDLIVTDNVGGSGSGNTENVGDVDSQGIELKVQYDLGIAQEWEVKNPYYVAFTYTDSVLDGDSQSTDAESLFANGKDGNKVPYVPEYQLAFGVGLEIDRWGLFLDGTYSDETFSSADNVESSTTDARFGKTDDYLVFDLSAQYNWTDEVKTFVNLQNITDEEYIVSRHPHGARPGRPFSMLAGVEIEF